jgi:hypothetical protein
MPVAGLHRASPSTTLDKSYLNVKNGLIALASNISWKKENVNNHIYFIPYSSRVQAYVFYII